MKNKIRVVLVDSDNEQLRSIEKYFSNHAVIDIVRTYNDGLSAINYIKEKDAYDLLDDKIKQVAEYRIKYPDSSLIELSEIISVETNNKITKSCVNHRLRKIKDLADKLRNRE